MIRRLRPTAAVIGALVLAGCTSLPPAAAVPTAMAAHEVCSAMFVSDLDGKRAFADTVAPQLGPAARLVRVQADPTRKTVTAALAGLYARRATYREPYGCVVGDEASNLPVVDKAGGPPPPTQESSVVRTRDTELTSALDIAFSESSDGPRRRTYAAVIVHDGRIVAERYAPGVGVDTPLHGWSMGKSVTNALLGVLVKQGRLDMFAPAPVPEWRDPADARHSITPDDLLRMRSGLDVGQSLIPRWNAPFDPANRIMFASPDMGAAAARRALKSPVRSAWTYSDGNTAVLGRLIRQTAGGGDPAATQSFARRELFERLGMGSVTIETDATGSPVGATQVYASARDWARLGQLYLDDGVAGGQRIFPAGWVEYSTTLTPGSNPYGYGAGFWVTSGSDDHGLPVGSFLARGARGQYVIVVPSARLVVAKLGDADAPRGDFEAMVGLVGALTKWANSTGRRDAGLSLSQAPNPASRPRQ
ncbi:serine hydrolase [Phenylobacterium sp.]|uniref:serine hydrolase domain-containing protein n=1 Tax=Phenylobacterium sp. TaxID=1871053 RepID=UPI00286C7BC8|nr:serine hydrolase [Phenylobacterium sp.]